MKHGLLLTLLLCLLALPVGAQEEPSASTWSVFTLGNEYELGGGVMLEPGDVTSFGLDARWYDQEDDIWAASGVVLWNAIPTATIPLGGLFPQLNLPIPDAVDVGINLGGRLGYQRNETTETDSIIASVIVEGELNPGKRATLAIRYEYAFDSDVWNELPAEPKQHQAFLVLKYLF